MLLEVAFALAVKELSGFVWLYRNLQSFADNYTQNKSSHFSKDGQDERTIANVTKLQKPY